MRHGHGLLRLYRHPESPSHPTAPTENTTKRPLITHHRTLHRPTYDHTIEASEDLEETSRSPSTTRGSEHTQRGAAPMVETSIICTSDRGGASLVGFG